MSVNGHFANMGEKPTKEQYEHGIQVINENQEFKYVLPAQSQKLQVLMSCAVQSYSSSISITRESFPGWLQLSPNLRLWFTVHGQINTSKPPLRDRVWRHGRR